jgi:hypothetical protein
MDINTNSWLQSCKSFTITNEKILEAYLYDGYGNVIFNRIELHPLLKEVHLLNNKGIFQYNPTEEQNGYIMDTLFPTYLGETIPKITIKKCVMLSIDTKKYNKNRNETLHILNNYNLPEISTHIGYSPQTVTRSKFYQYMLNKEERNELTCGMLEIFENFVSESNGNEWLLFFEDDVRPVNIDKNENLQFLHNVPKDAELIRPYIGSNALCDFKNLKYKKSFNGGLTHAFYISTTGCKKVLHYVKKYKWLFASDIDLYRLSKYSIEVPTGFDAWGLFYVHGFWELSNKLEEDEKICIYHLDHIIFNQTSLPCAPLRFS